MYFTNRYDQNINELLKIIKKVSIQKAASKSIEVYDS